jgi:hypothetical protein
MFSMCNIGRTYGDAPAALFCGSGYRRGNQVFRPAKVVVNDLSHADTGRSAD